MVKKKIITVTSSSENDVKSVSPVKKRMRRSRMSQEEIDCAMDDAQRVLESLRKIASGDYTKEMRRQSELDATTVKAEYKRLINFKRSDTGKRRKVRVEKMFEKKKQEKEKLKVLLVR